MAINFGDDTVGAKSGPDGNVNSMKSMIRAFAATAALVAPLTAQTPAAAAPTPAFAVADVHPSPSRLHPGIDGHFTAERIVLRDATITDLISTAYHVQAADILGGPAWLDFDRFDINAKPPAGTKITREDDDPAVAAMLRNLLSERFGLVVRTEQRPLPAYVLTVLKPGLLKPTTDSASDMGCQMQSQPNSAPDASLVHLTCHGVHTKQLAEILQDVGPSYFKRPVQDQTGLTGAYDIDLVFSYNKPGDNGGVSLPDAVTKQLGLKIESKPVPTPVVIVQSVNEKPTPNVANLASLLPPPPPRQFDVAVIRPANPGEMHFNIETTGHRVTVQYATLLTLIYKSFDEPPSDIQNQPKWLDDQHWDITGTVASNAAAPLVAGHEPDIDYEDVKEMLRSLLADRFGLVTHMGSRPATVFALTADSPHMKPAQENEHPGCAEGPGPDGKDTRVENPMRDRLISCQNMTMAQFATELHRLASGYIPAPVIDSTGLPGGYDFSISFSRANKLSRPESSPTAVSPTAATGSSDAGDPAAQGLPPISLFDALQKQLGVKLVKKDSVPRPVLVIDHVEDHPSEN